MSLLRQHVGGEDEVFPRSIADAAGGRVEWSRLGTSRDSQPADIAVQRNCNSRHVGARSLLMIASRFPPVASVGAIRLRKFAKYLGEFGWNVVVITGALRRQRPGVLDARRAVDEASLSDVPRDVKVFRLSSTADDWPGHASRRIAGGLSGLLHSFGMDESAVRDGLRWRLDQLHARLSFPDRGIFRLFEATRLAARLHRRYRFDAIFSSGMPFSDHLIGLAVRRALRRPWIADFRDPWYEYIHWEQWRGAGTRGLTRLAEALVVRSATCVTSVNDAMTRRFRERYARERRAAFATVRNGFDPADFVAADVKSESLCNKSAEQGSVFTLLYAGSLYETRSPANVLAALRQFVQARPECRGRVRFDFLGRPGTQATKLAELEREGLVRYVGMKPHAEACAAMAAAGLNVILLPDIAGGKADTTAKLYECIGSGRPILAAVPPDGAAAAELVGVDGVSRCHPNDIDGMAAAIGHWYDRWHAGNAEPARKAETLVRFTRRQQAGELAALLNAAIERRGRMGDVL